MDNHAFQTDDHREKQGNNQRAFTVDRYQSRSDNNDYLVEVNTRAKLLQNPGLYKRLSIGFLILAVIFFITSIVFIALYEKPKPKICTSNECVRTAANYMSSIDFDIDPCDDFYEFACGRWSEEHPSHGWWSSFNSFTTISEKVAIASMNVLQDEGSDDEPEALNKSRIFYKSCLNTEALDELGITSIYPFLTKMKLPIVPSIMTTSNKSASEFNWLRTDALIKNVLLMDVFVGATVGPNIFNGSQNVLYFGQIYQTSPLPSPVKKKTNIRYREIVKRDGNEDEEALQERMRSVTSNIIKKIINSFVLNNTGQEADDGLLTKAADIIVEMSDIIDEIVTNTTDTDQQEDDTFPISIENLQNEINSVLKSPQTNFLNEYLVYLFNGTDVTINRKTDLLYVTKLDVIYLKLIMIYLSETPEEHIELYMWWASVYAMIINTSGDISDFIRKQLNSFSSSPETIVRSRSLECALLVNNYMGYATSYALADQSFLNDTKPKVERMVLGLKEAFVSHVNEIRWMDGKTKRATLEKSKEMITFIGYPDWLFKNGELDKHYKNVLVSPDAYLENMINVIVETARYNLRGLRRVHQRDWYSEPIEVNAFNAFSDNAINVPMAILNFPMYHLGLEVLNYGSIGSILGHELTHGFDNTGRKYDKYGNFVQWWTNKTIEAFENFTQCFVEQYENFTIPDVNGHVNGKKTLGENLADNGGLNQAFTAYKKYISTFGEEPKLPGFETYTSYQLFFIAYATIWCEATSVEDLENQLKYDEHSPNSIRVLGTLQNSEAFSKEFGCPRGSPMNPQRKCSIW